MRMRTVALALVEELVRAHAEVDVPRRAEALPERVDRLGRAAERDAREALQGHGQPASRR